MAIPDTSPVSLAAVQTELGVSSLADAISAAIPGLFDPTYAGTSDGLYQFRNYGASTWSVEPIITNTVQSPLIATTQQFRIDITEGTGVATPPAYPEYHFYADVNGSGFLFIVTTGGGGSPLTGATINIGSVFPAATTGDTVTFRIQGEDKDGNFSSFADGSPYLMI